MKPYIASLNGRLILQQETPLSQPEIRRICQDYHAKFTNTKVTKKSYYSGFRQINEELTEYVFEGCKT